MTYNSTKVSNGYLSNNPDFEVANDTIGDVRYQGVKLIDAIEGSTNPIGTAANPLNVQGATTSIAGEVQTGTFAFSGAGTIALDTGASGEFETAVISADFSTLGAFTFAFEYSNDSVNWTAIETAYRPLGQEMVALSSFTGFSLFGQAVFFLPLVLGSSWRINVTSGTGSVPYEMFLSRQFIEASQRGLVPTGGATDQYTSSIDSKLQTNASTSKLGTGQLRMGAEYNSSVTSDAVSGEIGTVRMSQARSIYVEVRSGTSAASLATSTLQTTGNSTLSTISSTLSTINGKITTVNTDSVKVTSNVLATGAATSALQTSGNSSLSSIDGKITACNTGAVTVSSSALPSGAATEATLAAIERYLTPGSTPTRLSVSASTSSVTLSAADADRIEVEIYNNSSAYLYVARGSTATTSDFTARVPPFQYYSTRYTGLITGVWSVASGDALVTETFA